MSIDDRRVFRIARRIMAGDSLGKSSYNVINDNTIGVTFSLDTNKTDEFIGWMDQTLGKKQELEAIANEYGVVLVKDKMKSNASFSLSFTTKDGSDKEGFLKALSEKCGINKG